MTAEVQYINTALNHSYRDIIHSLANVNHFYSTHSVEEHDDIKIIHAEKLHLNATYEWSRRLFWEEVSELFDMELHSPDLERMNLEIGELVLAAAWKRYWINLNYLAT